ncbi:MAG TPA: rod shape-determining protein MreD [Acidimicrobiales bacterium]|nr:rod shape-determining protein MreD [Acidimicrobiales bacterium]
MNDWALRLPPVLLAAVLVHTALAPNLRVFGVSADVLLLLSIAAGVAAGPERGAAVGFTCGVLADCFLLTPFGLSALVFAVVGYGVGVFQTGVLHSSWWIPAITAAVASAVGVVGYVLLGIVVGQDQLFSLRVVEVAGVLSVFHALLAPPAVRLMRWAVADTAPSGLLPR